jgi:hypothetical protein
MKLLLNILALVGLLLFARVTNPGGHATVSLFQDNAAKAPAMQQGDFVPPSTVITPENAAQLEVWYEIPQLVVAQSLQWLPDDRELLVDYGDEGHWIFDTSDLMAAPRRATQQEVMPESGEASTFRVETTDTTLQFFDASTNQLIHEIEGLLPVAINPDGSSVVYVQAGETVRGIPTFALWQYEIATGESTPITPILESTPSRIAQLLPTQYTQIDAVTFSPMGDVVLVNGVTREDAYPYYKTDLWFLGGATPQQNTVTYGLSTYALSAFNHDGTKLAVAKLWDELQVFEIDAAAETVMQSGIRPGSKEINDVAITGNNQHVVYQTANHLRHYDLVAQTERILLGLSSGIHTYVGQEVVAYQADNTPLVIHHLNTHEQQEIEGDYTLLALSPDDRFLAALGFAEDGRSAVFLWNIETASVAAMLDVSDVEGFGAPAVFSVDGTLFSYGNTIWDLSQGFDQPVRLDFDIPQDYVPLVYQSSVLNDNGMLIANTFWQNGNTVDVQVWNMTHGENTASLRTPSVFIDGFHSITHDLTFSADGRLLASAHTHELNIWDVEAGELAYQWLSADVILSAAFNTEATLLVVGTAQNGYDYLGESWGVDYGKVLLLAISP